jgi:GT2 family glycosyltransferase
MVSVIVVADERRDCLDSALRSVCAQTHDHLEILVVGRRAAITRTGASGFHDQSFPDPRIRYLDPATGIEPRNVAIEEARGEYLAFLDANDRWVPWRIECQVAALERRRDASVAWMDMTLVDDDGVVTEARHLRANLERVGRVELGLIMQPTMTLGTLANVPPDVRGAAVLAGDLASEILLGNLMHSSTILVRRDAAERIGGIDPAFAPPGDDYEFFIRLCSLGTAVFIDAPGLRRRVGHAEQRAWSSIALHVALNNLRAVREWMPDDGADIGISRAAVRRRFADSYAWLGGVELEAGHRIAALRWLLASLATRPAVDHRARTLLRCAVPRRRSNPE